MTNFKEHPTAIVGANKLLLGTRIDDNATIYLSKPTWDCGWYWGFGYLGNHKEHYHLSNYNITDDNKRLNRNMYDALLEDYNLVKPIKANLWEFCELALSIYTLKETAEVLGRGGSHMTKNPHAELIKNPNEVHRINYEVLPVLMQTLWDLCKE